MNRFPAECTDVNMCRLLCVFSELLVALALIVGLQRRLALHKPVNAPACECACGPLTCFHFAELLRVSAHSLGSKQRTAKGGRRFRPCFLH